MALIFSELLNQIT